MRLSDFQIAHRSGTVMRVGRKQSGLSQRQLAKLIDVSQSKYAKMELGKLIPNVREWEELKRILDLPGLSYELGKIDRGLPMDPLDKEYSGNFFIPPQYSQNRGSRVRLIRNYLDAFEKTVGTKHVLEFLRSKNMDPDFFYDLDHQINLQFAIDLVSHWNSVSPIQNHNIAQICKPFSSSEFSGYRWLELSSEKPTIDQALVSFIDAVQFWENNFEYSIEKGTRTWVDISVKGRSHLAGFGGLAAFGHVFCQYRKFFFRQYGKFCLKTSTDTLEVLDLECVNHGDSRCIYKIINR